jgi:hypothetical protein
MRKRLSVVTLILCILLLVACAPKTVEIKSFYELTPKEKLTYMYQIYNAQHEDYMAMSKLPSLTEGQKKMMRLKKPTLDKLKLLIPMYDTSVQQGTPSRTDEQEIYDMLNSLQSLVPLN